MRSVRLTAACLVLAATAGCGLIGGAPEEPNGELETIKVAELKLIDIVPLRLAINEGYFKDEGLKIELSTGSKGSANVDNVLGGSIEIGMTSYPPAIAAHAKAKPLKVVADAVQTNPNSVVLVVKKDSPIKRVEDLVGKKIATSSPKGISELAMNSQFRTLGIDPKKVSYVSGEIAGMPSMVNRGDVDAAIIAEPHVQVAYKDGVTRLADPFTGPTAGFPWGGFVATEKWVKDNHNKVERFQRAYNKGAAEAVNQRTKVIEILKNDVGVQENIAQLAVLPVFPTSVDPIRLQRVVDLMRENGEKGPDGGLINVDMHTMMVSPPS